MTEREYFLRDDLVRYEACLRAAIRRNADALTIERCTSNVTRTREALARYES
jgi:hypothetical protein